MSTVILKVEIKKYKRGTEIYPAKGEVSKTHNGLRPGDVLKVIDVDSGEVLITGIMSPGVPTTLCTDCIFKRSTEFGKFCVCNCIPCVDGFPRVDTVIRPIKPEDVLEDL